MNMKELLNSLINQDENLDNLITTLELQKKSIVEGKYEELENAITQEQRILKSIQSEETTRVKMISEIALTNSLPLKENSVDELLTHGKALLGNDAKSIQQVRIAIKYKLNDILRLNSQLKVVIELSRNLIKDTMMLLVGPRKQAFVNKKV